MWKIKFSNEELPKKKNEEELNKNCKIPTAKKKSIKF